MATLPPHYSQTVTGYSVTTSYTPTGTVSVQGGGRERREGSWDGEREKCWKRPHPLATHMDSGSSVVSRKIDSPSLPLPLNALEHLTPIHTHGLRWCGEGVGKVSGVIGGWRGVVKGGWRVRLSHPHWTTTTTSTPDHYSVNSATRSKSQCSGTRRRLRSPHWGGICVYGWVVAVERALLLDGKLSRDCL